MKAIIADITTPEINLNDDTSGRIDARVIFGIIADSRETTFDVEIISYLVEMTSVLALLENDEELISTE